MTDGRIWAFLKLKLEGCISSKDSCSRCWKPYIYGILLHSGLNPAWHFWLSTRFSCCLKMKSVENILGYIREQFYRFLRRCKPQEKFWNCSRKYTKMFKTYFIFSQQKIKFKPMSGVIMQQDVLLHFWMIFLSPSSLGPLLVWVLFWFRPSSGSSQK